MPRTCKPVILVPLADKRKHVYKSYRNWLGKSCRFIPGGCYTLNKELFILHSSRVYYPCILGVEMLEIRILLASPMLALRGGWEAGMMNKHTPIMDT